MSHSSFSCCIRRRRRRSAHHSVMNISYFILPFLQYSERFTLVFIKLTLYLYRRVISSRWKNTRGFIFADTNYGNQILSVRFSAYSRPHGARSTLNPIYNRDSAQCGKIYRYLEKAPQTVSLQGLDRSSDRALLTRVSLKQRSFTCLTFPPETTYFPPVIWILQFFTSFQYSRTLSLSYIWPSNEFQFPRLCII